MLLLKAPQLFLKLRPMFGRNILKQLKEIVPRSDQRLAVIIIITTIIIIVIVIVIAIAIIIIIPKLYHRFSPN